MRADRAAPHHNRNEFQRQRWRGILADLSANASYERSRLDDRRAAVIKQYTQKFPNLTDADAKAMADQMFDCESRLAELKKKYYKKFNKVLPALTVTKFFYDVDSMPNRT